MERLIDFASSVPDFRRLGKGNVRHRLSDIIILMILARASKCVCRGEIIEFGRHNINKFRKLGMLKNGVPSEATLCRIEQGIDDTALVRNHWSIESMHWTLDFNLLQDKVKRKSPRAARNLDTIQRIVHSLFSIWKWLRKKHSDKKKGIAELMRNVAMGFTGLLRFLCQK